MANTFLEKTLEDIICEAPKDQLDNRGLRIRGKLFRQLKIGNYGIADLVAVSKSEYGQGLNFTIYELKKDKIDAGAMIQAFRYCKGIKQYLKHRNFKFYHDFRIVLIGSEIAGGDFCYSNCFIDSMEIFTYSYDFDGIYFKDIGSYYLNKEGFNG